MLHDRYLTSELYRGILWNTLVPFARQHFGDNHRYQGDKCTPPRTQVVLDFLQKGNVTKMERPARSPDCNPIKHTWGELGGAITISMDNPPQNIGELRQAVMDKWSKIPVEHLRHLGASMPECVAAIIAATGGNIRYWPGIHKTTPTDSIRLKVKFGCPDLPQLPSSDILVCSCSQFIQYQ